MKNNTYIVNQQERQNLSKTFLLASKDQAQEIIVNSSSFYKQLKNFQFRSFSLKKETEKELTDKDKVYLAGLLFEGKEFPFEFVVRKNKGNARGMSVDLYFIYRSDSESPELIKKLEKVIGGKTIKKPHGFEHRQENRRLVSEKVLTFYKNYKLPHTTGRHDETFKVCEEITQLIEKGEHRKKEGLKKILKLGCAHQEKGLKGKGRKMRSLEEWYNYLSTYEKESQTT